MRKHKNILLIICTILLITAAGCLTQQKGSALLNEHAEFLAKDPSARELFHVLISSDHYVVAQMRNEKTILRKEDEGGDKYISDEIKKLNKVDLVRDGIYSIWLYPDNGRLMKIRTQMPTYLMEVDTLLTEDIQRWAFDFPIKRVEPTRFDIRYRVVLKKTMKDEDIIKEIQDKMREEN